MNILRIIKTARIKDSILMILKDTVHGTNPMLEEEFQKEISKISYEQEDIDLCFDALKELDYVDKWDSGNEIKVRAIKKTGKLKLKEGGFISSLFWPLLLTFTGAMLVWILQIFIKYIFSN
jgi:hypothetical protein